MPVILCQQRESSDSLNVSLNAVVRDLPKENPAAKALKHWLNGKKSTSLWTAIFNERVVGFALVSERRLKAIAVHPATRGRGIGRRILTILVENQPSLKLAKGEDNKWIVDCYHNVSTKKGW